MPLIPSFFGSIYRVSGIAPNTSILTKVSIFRLNHMKLLIVDIWAYVNYKNGNSTLLQRKLKHCTLTTETEIKYLNTKLGI